MGKRKKNKKYPFRIVLEIDEEGRRIKFEGEDELKNAVMMAASRFLNKATDKIFKAIEDKLKKIEKK